MSHLREEGSGKRQAGKPEQFVIDDGVLEECIVLTRSSAAPPRPASRFPPNVPSKGRESSLVGDAYA